MTIAHYFSDKVRLELGGRTWPVVFTHQVLLEAEEATGLSVLDGELHPVKMSAKTLRAVVHTILRLQGGVCSLEDVGRMISRPQIVAAVRRSIVKAWSAAMREPEERTDEDGAPLLQPKTSWMQLWADNRQTLGISDAEWLAMTPRMVQALSRPRLEILRQKEFLLSGIHSDIINFSQCRPDRQIDRDHFMLHKWPNSDGKVTKGDDVMRAFSSVPNVFKTKG